jgi:hypothetical protein
LKEVGTPDLSVGPGFPPFRFRFILPFLSVTSERLRRGYNPWCVGLF